MAWIREEIEVDESLGPDQREALAQEVVDFIVERSKNSRDKNGRPFPGYSKSYKKSLDFKIAGKSSRVNLTLSGDMLNSIKVLNHRKGKIKIGFDRSDTENNGKAEGNIKGTYGTKTENPAKARDFLGISNSALNRIQSKYKINSRNRDQVLERIARIKVLLNDNRESN